MARKIKIAPSLLAADLARAGEQVNAAWKAGADVLHVDVMDGHFAPNLSFGPAVVDAINNACDIPIASHLMVTNPENFIDSFIEAGSNHIFYHCELDADLVALARRIREAGAHAGITLEMQTPAERVASLVGEVDIILVMTVMCGYTGQALNPEPLRKIKDLRRIFGEDIDIAVDGGIDLQNAGLVARAGANVLVAGKAVFWSPDPADAIAQLRKAAGG